MRLFTKLAGPPLVLVILASCGGGLSVSLKREISLGNQKVQTAAEKVRQCEASLSSYVASNPDLFRGAPELTAWNAKLGEADEEIKKSRNAARELTRLAERNRPDQRISQLLGEERKSSEAALLAARAIDQESAKWRDYQRDPVAFAAKIDRERDTIRKFDVAPVTKTVRQAEEDWPEKKVVLEERLALLSGVKTIDSPLEVTPSALIAEESALSHKAIDLSADAQQLQSACGQLYDSWDNVLTDLDRSRVDGNFIYRERLKTVRTHLVDVKSKTTTTNSTERWTSVPEASFKAVENDVGMAIAHKDVGRFDSEAHNTPQPPGFSYVASPSMGSNQYGYWSHSGGESVWTFLPQYLILRELLWNHSYRPVVMNEYRAYQTAQSRGTTYYGRETPNAAPKYGTHGTFTQRQYASSRYVQNGGFKGSAYGSGERNSSGSLLNRSRPESQSGSAAEPNNGKRFGRQSGSASSGQQFGRSSSSRPAGRSFGRRR